MSSLLPSRKGFSILMALGSIGVLLIVVVGLVSVFLSEMRLSRLQYDSILSSTQAEGAFEYAMLKVKNHRDGFADSMTSGDPDAEIFRGSTPRTSNVKINYKISASSNNTTFAARPSGRDRYIIIPLFTGQCQRIIGGTSCNPESSSGTRQVTQINELTSGTPNTLSWSIVAMSGSENVSLAGSGNIDPMTIGTVRLKSVEIQCYDTNGDKYPGAVTSVEECERDTRYSGEELSYFYDLTGTVSDFLRNASTSRFKDMSITDPYLLIFSEGADADITLKTDRPFTLPELSVTAEARKGDALQSVRFTEDKNKYYDALKYGIYNDN